MKLKMLLQGPKRLALEERRVQNRRIDDPGHVPEFRFPEFYTGLSPNNLYL